jgi:hypothetical protein
LNVNALSLFITINDFSFSIFEAMLPKTFLHVAIPCLMESSQQRKTEKPAVPATNCERELDSTLVSHSSHSAPSVFLTPVFGRAYDNPNISVKGYLTRLQHLSPPPILLTSIRIEELSSSQNKQGARLELSMNSFASSRIYHASTID